MQIIDQDASGDRRIWLGSLLGIFPWTGCPLDLRGAHNGVSTALDLSFVRSRMPDSAEIPRFDEKCELKAPQEYNTMGWVYIYTHTSANAFGVDAHDRACSES